MKRTKICADDFANMVEIRHKERGTAKFKYIKLYSSKTEAEMVVEREREGDDGSNSKASKRETKKSRETNLVGPSNLSHELLLF